jgi:hypothetical protein
VPVFAKLPAKAKQALAEALLEYGRGHYIEDTHVELLFALGEPGIAATATLYAESKLDGENDRHKRMMKEKLEEMFAKLELPASVRKRLR